MPHPNTHRDEQTAAPLELVLLGLPKTATTWLAQALAQTGTLTVFDESDKIEQLWNRQHGAPLMIAESVTDPLFLGDIERRRPALQSLAARLRADRYVLVLREPVDWVCSLYRQYLRRGGTLPLRAFFGSGADRIVQSEYVDYERLVDDVSAAIGGSLAICSYSHLKGGPRGFINSLAEAFGNPPSLANLGDLISDEALNRRANVGVRGLGAQIVRRVNRLRRSQWNPDGSISWKRFERLPWHVLAGVGPDVIGDDDREWLKDEVARRNEWAAWTARFCECGVVVHD